MLRLLAHAFLGIESDAERLSRDTRDVPRLWSAFALVTVAWVVLLSLKPEGWHLHSNRLLLEICLRAAAAVLAFLFAGVAVLWVMSADFSRLHRLIDTVTFRVEHATNAQLRRSLADALCCSCSPHCPLRHGQIGRTVFLALFSRDHVGPYDQRSARERIHCAWWCYRTVNIVSLSLVAVAIFALLLSLTSASARLIQAAVGILALLIAFWQLRGRQLRREIKQLIDEQVKAFVGNASAELVLALASSAGHCRAAGCTVAGGPLAGTTERP